jgi:hypothetical protein
VGFPHARWGNGALSIPPTHLPTYPKQVELVGWQEKKESDRGTLEIDSIDTYVYISPLRRFLQSVLIFEGSCEVCLLVSFV